MNYRIVDLTIPISDGMDAFPGEPTANFSPFSTHEDGGIEMWNVSIFSQLGTHVDAPSHFIKSGAASESLDLHSMIGPACIIDVGGHAHMLITRRDLEPYRDAIERRARVLIRTGWSDKFGSPEFWTDFPTLSPDAAKFLVECGVVFLGIDTPTPSVVDLHEVHQILLGAGCVLAECLVGLTQLSSNETFIVCLPLKLVGLDGAPARIVAFEGPGPLPEQ